MIIAVVVVVVIAAGAFVLLSGDDGKRDEYVDALTAGYVASGQQSEDPLLAGATEDDLGCLAETVVDVVGVDRLEDQYTPEELQAEFEEDPDFDLDVTEDDPTQAEAEQLVDGLDRCLSFFSKMRDQMQSQFTEDPRFSPEALDCVLGALDDDFLRTAMVDDVMETTEARTATSDRVESECGHLFGR